ncbi:hypothetical protein N9Q03_01295 [Flavobacteriaceae bacterium]|nr:hypothetical protein [Flavobacteriaceae bacterium]
MMKKLYFLSALLIFACSTDSEGNPCIYEPTLTTEAATDITETSATLNGVISIVSENCDVPNNTEQGFVYSTEIQPTLEDTQVNVNGTNISTTIEGLTPNTTYYVRAFLTNNLGDFYGDEISFTTANEICECNNETLITYGNQEWAAFSSCHITYRDGTPIPQVTDNDEWANLTTGAWCYSDNDPSKCILYNWYAVEGIHDNDPNTPNKEFAPEGWHVPSDDEWYVLEAHLVSEGYGNGDTCYTFGERPDIAKAMASTNGWSISGGNAYNVGNNQSTNNSSGFNGIPLPNRNTLGYFPGLGNSCIFWTSTPYDTFDESAIGRGLFYGSQCLGKQASFKVNGFKVRLVKD